MKRAAIILLIIYVIIFKAASQPAFLTTAERTDFSSTSDYDDVNSFIDKLKKLSPWIRVESIASSSEGRVIPLLVIGKPLPESPESLKNDKRLVIYMQANIHAGEVEGKEATLMFARDLLSEKNPEILKDLVILICPNFNPDGNEQISTANRTHQSGPVNGVGVRYNGMMLDLNRDGMKAESPEVRGLLTNVFNRWDPYLFIDCHTTNGSYHIEPVTFTWMVNPNGDRTLINYMSDRMMPVIHKSLADKYKVENCYYGEFASMTEPEKGWYFDASEPRYITNYFGLRNRLAILNENYVYADFKSRVYGNYYLLKAMTDYAVDHKEEIKDLVNDADRRTVLRGESPSVSDSFAVEYRAKPLADPVTVKTYEAEIYTDPNGRRGYRRTDRRKDVTIPYYIDYYGSKSVRFPFAYILTITDPEVIGLLRTHGIRLERLSENTTLKVERFDISELKGSARLNQGHYSNTIKGSFKSENIDFKAGSYVIRTAQPLANVAAYLLEPLSNDGLVVWNYLDRYLSPQWGPGFSPLPVYRVIEPVSLNTRGD